MSNELDLLLDEWKALTAAATPGPWRWEPPSGAAWPVYDESLVTEDGEAVLLGWGYDASGIEGDPADRKFIALSRTIAPRLLAAVEAVLEEHRPVEVEPSGTICGECSFRLPNGRYFGKVVEWPCPTVTAIHAALIGDNDE